MFYKNIYDFMDLQVWVSCYATHASVASLPSKDGKSVDCFTAFAMTVMGSGIAESVIARFCKIVKMAFYPRHCENRSAIRGNLFCRWIL